LIIDTTLKIPISSAHPGKQLIIFVETVMGERRLIKMSPSKPVNIQSHGVSILLIGRNRDVVLVSFVSYYMATSLKCQ